jgi:hypothetical protein
MKFSQMLWFERDREKDRFYLLPGMGGRARRRKELRFLCWALAAGVVVSGVVATILFFISQH